MKKRLIAVFVGAAIALWATPGLAQQSAPLPATVNATGVLSGVATTGAGLLTVPADTNINTTNNPAGGITTNVAAPGGAIVTFLGNSTVTGIVGTGPFPFSAINAGVAGTTVNLNGLVFTTTFNITGTGTVNFNGGMNFPGTAASTIFNAGGDGFISVGAGKTLNSAITTAAGAGTGTLTLNAGSTVNGAIGALATEIKRINVVGGNASIVGAVFTAGLSLGTNTLDMTGSALTTRAGATISTSFASNALFGNVKAANVDTGLGIKVTPTVTGVLTPADFVIIKATASATVPTAVTVVNTNPRYIFTGLTTIAPGDVVIRLAGVVPLANLVTTPAALAVAPILDVTAAPGTPLAIVQNAVAALSTAAAINSALVQLAPASQNIAAPLVAGQATNQFGDILMGRVEEIQNLCCDDCGPDKAQNNTRKCTAPELRSNSWAKAYARNGFQHDNDGALGYKTNAEGILLAHDVPVGEQTRVGLGGGYSFSAINGNYGTGRATIDSYQIMGYFSHAPGPWFVQGAVQAGRDNYDGSRNIVFPGVNQTATASYSGNQYTGLVRTGVLAYSQQFTLTPFASLQFSRVNVDGYTEQGAAGINLNVASQSYDFLQSGLGVKAERIIRSGKGTYAPEVHTKWLHQFKSTTMQQTAALTGGGGQFSTLGVAQDRDMFNVGAGITMLTCDCDKKQWSVKGLYDYNWNRSNYSGHQVSLIASRSW